MDLRTNSYYVLTQHSLIGISITDTECSLRGTNWFLDNNSGYIGLICDTDNYFADDVVI